jgi:hypothetical protein
MDSVAGDQSDTYNQGNELESIRLELPDWVSEVDIIWEIRIWELNRFKLGRGRGVIVHYLYHGLKLKLLNVVCDFNHNYHGPSWP